MSPERAVVITGGAGFIGSNLAHRLASAGRAVRIVDDLSRPGVERNLDWLVRKHGRRVTHIRAQVQDAQAVARALADASAVFHLAAQVAVTTSLAEPLTDFEVNARGTVNVLEAIRAMATRPPLVFTSTNKVYGALSDLAFRQRATRWEPVDDRIALRGISESRPLDFHSPYGCSKGAADQYVIDYARTFDLPAVVLRMSCIYGPRQFGTEDQGWVAHFVIRVLSGAPLTIYGDGKQVRDVLFVDDLVDALLVASDRANALAGRAFNLGGGPANAVSIIELLQLIEAHSGARPSVEYQKSRAGDQRYYVSDCDAFSSATGWAPKVAAREGLVRLAAWVRGGLGQADSDDVGRSAARVDARVREAAS